MRRPYNLPPLTTLVAFEAAARHLSLTRAAVELNVTTGAISKQIRMLEQELGHAVFRRMHRALALTEGGELLATTLQETFEKVSTTVRQLKSSVQIDGVSLGTTTAFAQLWLMPRLGAFWAGHPDIVIDHMISDRAQDLLKPDVDLRIRYGNGVWPDENGAEMFSDLILVVASPSFLRGKKIKAPRDLVEHPLLSVEGMDPSWTSWQDFLRAAGVAARRLKIRRFTSHVIALQAARAGQGLVLGWRSLVAPLLESGELVQVTNAEIVSPGSYYVTWSRRKSISPQAEILKQWLLAIDG